MSSKQRYGRDDVYDRNRDRDRRRNEKRRSRSNSRFNSHSHRDRDRDRNYSSRSRSRSIERRHRHRRDSYSRSPSNKNSDKNTRGYKNRDDDRHSRRRRDTRSKSRSRSHSKQRSTHTHPNTHTNSGDASERLAPSTTIDNEDLSNLPLPKQDSPKKFIEYDEDDPLDKERIHREIEEKLRQTLAKEGKIYPPPKPEAQHPVFANDGSFLEIFKKMQAQQSTAVISTKTSVVPSVVPLYNGPSTSLAATAGNSAPPPPLPMVGRRRGGKILKTGVVAKPKPQNESNADPKDFWSLYLAEVNKYKNTACESETGNRPLVK